MHLLMLGVDLTLEMMYNSLFILRCVCIVQQSARVSSRGGLHDITASIPAWQLKAITNVL